MAGESWIGKDFTSVVAYLASILLKALGKTTEVLSQDSNLVPPRHTSEAYLPQTTCSESSYMLHNWEGSYFSWFNIKSIDAYSFNTMSIKKMISNNVHSSAEIVNSQSLPNLHKITKHICNNLITVYFNKYVRIRI